MLDQAEMLRFRFARFETIVDLTYSSLEPIEPLVRVLRVFLVPD